MVGKFERLVEWKMYGKTRNTGSEGLSQENPSICLIQCLSRAKQQSFLYATETA
jgi:hypothetical protein